MTVMAARFTLGSPTAFAKSSPSPHAATPNAKARDMLSTVGAAAIAAVVAVALAAAVATAVLAVLAST